MNSRIHTQCLIISLLCLVFPFVPVFAQDAEPPGGLAPIEIELPEPFYGGTPLPFWDPNLEPEDYKDRPPLMAPEGTTLVSRGKPVTSSCNDLLLGELKMITDGDKGYEKESLVELSAGLQWVQIDLEAEYDIYGICVWHFHKGKQVYFDVIVRVSNDPEFKDGTTVYNNDTDNSSGLGIGEDVLYIENNKGRLIETPEGVRGRYVRLYSDGNTASELNHYVEVEVFGKPAS
jgi:hypothetical protein